MCVCAILETQGPTKRKDIAIIQVRNNGVWTSVVEEEVARSGKMRDGIGSFLEALPVGNWCTPFGTSFSFHRRNRGWYSMQKHTGRLKRNREKELSGSIKECISIFIRPANESIFQPRVLHADQDRVAAAPTLSASSSCTCAGPSYSGPS